MRPGQRGVHIPRKIVPPLPPRDLAPSGGRRYRRTRLRPAAGEALGWHMARPGTLALAAALAVVPGAARPDPAPPTVPIIDDRTLVALAVTLACAPAPEPPTERTATSDAEPELELIASVRAKSIVFDRVPDVKVRAALPAQVRTAWRAQRVNLPASPLPGVVYRDVQVKLTVTSTVDELGALLEEARRAAAGVRIEPEEPSAAGIATDATDAPSAQTSVKPPPEASQPQMAARAAPSPGATPPATPGVTASVPAARVRGASAAAAVPVAGAAAPGAAPATRALSLIHI